MLVWKAGTTDAGIKAAASHTANMTGSYDLYRAAMRQAGIIEVDDVEPIVDAAKLFAQRRLPKGTTVGVLSISGGSGVVFADAAVRAGLTLPPFSPDTLAKMRKLVPAFGSPENPADITAAMFNDTTLFARTLDVVLEDPSLDQLVDPDCLDLGPARGALRRDGRRRSRQDRQARQRPMVRPPGQVRGGREGLRDGGRAVRDDAGAARPRRSDRLAASRPIAGDCCRARCRAWPRPRASTCRQGP